MQEVIINIYGCVYFKTEHIYKERKNQRVFIVKNCCKNVSNYLRYICKKSIKNFIKRTAINILNKIHAIVFGNHRDYRKFANSF